MAPVRDVLQVLSSTDRRGAETFAIDLRDQLQERGLDIAAFALQAGSAGGFEMPVLGPRRFSPPGLWRLRREVRRSAVVVGHGSNTLLACAIGTAGTGRPFIYRNIGDPLFWSPTTARRWRVSRFLHRAAAVAALWPGSADILVEHFGVPRHKITIIPNGRPADAFPLVTPDARRASRAALGLGAGPVALAMGALSPEKRVDLAIVAAAQLPGWTLLVVGDGAERENLVRLAQERAPNRVIFAGTTSEPATMLAAADVVVLSSDTEGLPGVLIEAGLSGLPVAATDVGGVSAVVLDGETGRIVPANDADQLAAALVEVLADAQRLGTAARARCLQHFEMSVITDQWDALIGRVRGR